MKKLKRNLVNITSDIKNIIICPNKKLGRWYYFWEFRQTMRYVPGFRWVGDNWYKLKCWVWRRHTTIKPRNLDHTWCDKTELIPHILFECLSEFIENECSPGIVDWDSDRPHREVRRKMQELYDWWNNHYIPFYFKDKFTNMICDQMPVGINPDVILNKKFATEAEAKMEKQLFHVLSTSEDRISKELSKKCKQIITLRRWMWT